MRNIGTSAFGVRAPIIKQGDGIVDFVVKAVLESGIVLRDRDVIGLTESIVARAQGNYVSTTEVADEINDIFEGDIGIVFPILSRNRFATVLKGISMSNKKIYLQLSFPSDEVGNQLMDIEKMDKLGVDPCNDVFGEKKYRELFGEMAPHPFTGIDYVDLYNKITKGNIKIIFSNDPSSILKYTKEIIAADVHSNKRTIEVLKKSGAKRVISLSELCTKDKGSGYNPEYGLLGSNKAGENKLKLFPRNCYEIVKKIQEEIFKKTSKKVEVMVYGDGAFKDPIGRIWELADPVVSPGYTEGLKGTPKEIKIKYIADTKLADLRGEKLDKAIKEQINHKADDLSNEEAMIGTTPRQITDLIGSLCDLVSGSGDKGTPIVVVQGYFDNYATE